jgi:NAD(P)-dependent dehydrogenase (short-subunit alcohol dehydrogenase family)
MSSIYFSFGFTAFLAGEVGRYNIRVNCVSSAGFFTEGFQNGMTYDEFMNKMLQS